MGVNLSNEIYILIGETGEYADQRNWIVAAYTNRGEVEKHKEEAQEWADKFDYWDFDFKAHPNLDPKAKLDHNGITYEITTIELRTESPPSYSKTHNDE